jgi:hypothetical protein
MRRLPVHPGLPENLPLADALHQYPPTNLAPLLHICVHPFIVNEGATVFDCPVTSATPLHFLTAVYKVALRAAFVPILTKGSLAH